MVTTTTNSSLSPNPSEGSSSNQGLNRNIKSDPSQEQSLEAPLLFVQTAFLGDLLLSIPTLKRLKLLFPKKELYLVCRKGLGSLMLQLKVCDQVYEIEKGNQSTYKNVKEKLSSIHFDKIICPHESMTSALFVQGLNSKSQYSYRQWWNFIFFKYRISKPLGLPEALRQMTLLSEFDSDLSSKLSFVPQDQSLFEVPDWASAQLLPWLGTEQAIAIFPGSVWPTKKWTVSGFQKLARYFHDYNYKIVLLGSAQEKEICDQIAMGLERVENFAGQKTLMESLLILQKSQVCISNDSGGQHLASVCGVPTVSIFGPTVIQQGFRPWNSKSEIAEIKNLKCRPCGKHGHKKCPLGTHECMEKLEPQVVIERVQRLLNLVKGH